MNGTGNAHRLRGDSTVTSSAADGRRGPRWDDDVRPIAEARRNSSLQGLGIEGARQALEQIPRKPGPEMERVQAAEFDGPHGPVPVRVYTPIGCALPAPALIWFHGGGMIMGSLRTPPSTTSTGCRRSPPTCRGCPPRSWSQPSSTHCETAPRTSGVDFASQESRPRCCATPGSAMDSSCRSETSRVRARQSPSWVPSSERDSPTRTFPRPPRTATRQRREHEDTSRGAVGPGRAMVSRGD